MLFKESNKCASGVVWLISHWNAKICNLSSIKISGGLTLTVIVMVKASVIVNLFKFVGWMDSLYLYKIAVATWLITCFFINKIICLRMYLHLEY